MLCLKRHTLFFVIILSYSKNLYVRSCPEHHADSRAIIFGSVILDDSICLNPVCLKDVGLSASVYYFGNVSVMVVHLCGR